MKKYLGIGVVTILLVTFVTGCKKSNSPAPKDYTASFKDKTWWGMFTYTGKDAEYYSVHFNADNTLLWSQFSGDYTGQWAINGKNLTMAFDVSKGEIKADISDDDKLQNITGNTENFEINTGLLIANPNVALENTRWEGNPILTNVPYSFSINFVPDFKADLQETYFYPPSLYKSFLYAGNAYKRSASGAVIRAEISAGGAGATTRFFGVIISDSEMKCSKKNPSNLWQATKK